MNGKAWRLSKRMRCEGRRGMRQRTKREHSTMPFFLLLLLLILTSITHCRSLTTDVDSLLKFKRLIELDPHNVLSQWNGTKPCNWFGVTCTDGRVTTLELKNFSLKGALASELGHLSFLKNLLLSNNQFQGNIPKHIGHLRDLEVLDLANNKLGGIIPSELGHASKLTKLYLHSNELKGLIPRELGNLSMLQHLTLNMNVLAGQIPGLCSASSSGTEKKLCPQSNEKESSRYKGLCSLTNLLVGDFSHNYLCGKVPSCLNYLPRSSFEWNCFQQSTQISHQKPSSKCSHDHPSSFLPPKHEEQGNPSWWTDHFKTVGVGFIALSVFLLVGLAFFLQKRYKVIKPNPWRTNSWDSLDKGTIPGVPYFSRVELHKACEDFSNIIGSSDDSVVFKGILSNGSEVAVSSLRLPRASWSRQSDLYFKRKVEGLGRMDHEHIVKLLGFCCENDPFTRMLVFEYMPNGTLYDLLHNGEAEALDWNTRMRILMGVAYGLQYLHHEATSPPNFVLLDSSSVYLTEDFAAKLADFEIWKAAAVKGNKRWVANKSNSIGHDDLEGSERESGELEMTILGFGVILLELITGRQPYSKEQGMLVEWASGYLKDLETIADIVDPVLKLCNYDQLEAVCRIARVCTLSDLVLRPNMKQIVAMLESALGISSKIARPKSSPLLWAELAILGQD